MTCDESHAQCLLKFYILLYFDTTLGNRLLFLPFNDFISIQGNLFTGGCKEIVAKKISFVLGLWPIKYTKNDR